MWCRSNPHSLRDAKEMLGQFFRNGSSSSKRVLEEMKFLGLSPNDEEKLKNDCNLCVGKFEISSGGLYPGWKVQFAFDELEKRVRIYYVFNVNCSESVTVDNSFSERL